MGNIAIIPARSGSKGLNNKNIRDLCGKPLLAHTILAAKNSKMFDVIHVSTDSEGYAAIARAYGADVPFLRTPEISGDTASSWDAVRFVLEEYGKGGQQFDTLMLLQPTSPLRTDEDIINAYKIFQEKNARAVISVCETEHSPITCDTIAADGNMKGFVKKEYRDVRRQDLPTYYRVNGAVYLLKTSQLSNISNLFDDACYAYVMDKMNSVDIDNELDFSIAKVIMEGRIQI